MLASPARVSRLRRPVVSVGNLRVGGSGKTPVVGACRAAAARPWRDARRILTRGYGANPPGARRDGRVRRRAAAGRRRGRGRRTVACSPVRCRACRSWWARIDLPRDRWPNASSGVTVHLLDDGFQHVQLARDVDLLLVDEQRSGRPRAAGGTAARTARQCRAGRCGARHDRRMPVPRGTWPRRSA